MQYTKLGRTGLDVSRICLGTWQLSGSWGDVDQAAAMETLQLAYGEGINFFDTAHAYGFGAAEKLLGEGLRTELDNRREDIVIATKGGVRRTSKGNVRDSNPEFLRAGLDQSLNDMGLDYVDIFLLHWPDENTSMESIADTVNRFVDEGKVRHLGASNFSVEQLQKISSLTDIEVLQPGYNLLRRGVEDSVLPYCRSNNTGVFVYGTLAHGLLTGKFDSDSEFQASDWRSKSPVFQGDAFEQNVSMIERLSAFAKGLGLSVAELATAWTLAQPGVHCAIVGSKRVDQLPEAVRAGSAQLSASQIDTIEEIVGSGVPIGGPSPEGGVAS